MDAHELICAVKDMALELGRSPRKAEFEAKVKGAKYALERDFGNFTALMIAAGLETYNDRRKGPKINNSVFERSIEAHLEAHKEQPILKRTPWPKIATISDIHWPFSSPRVLERFYRFIEGFQPEYVILNGDAWDMYSHAKFPRSHNLFTPREEQDRSRAMNEEFWKEVKKRAPHAKLQQTLGNHDVRPLKRALEAYPAAEDWIARIMKELFTFDGVETIFDPRQEIVLGDIAIFHGYRSQLGSHRDYTLMNSINGHTHRGGVVFRQIRGQVLWELNSGFAGDPEAKGLTYTAQRISDWTPGFGAVDADGPRFIPA